VPGQNDDLGENVRSYGSAGRKEDDEGSTMSSIVVSSKAHT
jgi:hypothetical protein